MKTQTDNAFKVISRYGCYFFSLLHIAEVITGKSLSDERVMKLYAEAVCSGLMDWKCYVMKPGKLCSLAVYDLNRKSSPTVKYIGWWNYDMTEEDKRDGMWGGSDIDYTVLRYRTKYGNHFTTH